MSSQTSKNSITKLGSKLYRLPVIYQYIIPTFRKANTVNRVIILASKSEQNTYLR